MSIKLVSVEEAVGMVLPHDITEIVPGKKKGPAFKKGHIIRAEDIEHLKRIGKNHIYVLSLSDDELHEDEAALRMAEAIAGKGIEYDERPSEGKVKFRALHDGVFHVDRARLLELNILGEVMLATRHDYSLVRKGDIVAAGRAIPLVVGKNIVDRAVSIASMAGGLIEIRPRVIEKAAIIVTGQEVYEGRIKDAFGPAMEKKLKEYGLDVISVVLAPDNIDQIRNEIETALQKGAELILCTGGMSVDPDDVTRTAIREAGAHDAIYGAPVIPGAMFLVGTIGKTAVIGVPACGMYFRTTILDLVLPRVLTGERFTREKIAALGHGGLCLSCKKCTYPICPFGKG